MVNLAEREMPASARASAVPAMPQTADAMILTLTRTCCGDARLREIAGEERIAAVVEETVHDLWGRAAVKTFIPVLAMRQVRATLGG